MCQEFCQDEIARIEEMDKKRDKDYQAASDECNTTGKCNKLIDLNKQMYEVMDWKGELSKDYESKHPNQTNGRWDEKQKRWVPPKDDNGGLSFSAYQIQAGKPTVEKSYEKSTMKDFMTYLQVAGLDAYKALQDAGGIEAAWKGDDKFVQAWKKLAGDTDFVRYQEEFIEQKKFAPSYQYAGRLVPDLEDRSKVLDEIIWSGAVQHGAGKKDGSNGNNQIMYRAWTGKTGAGDEQLVREYYKTRIARYPDYAKRYNANDAYSGRKRPAFRRENGHRSAGKTAGIPM